MITGEWHLGAITPNFTIDLLAGVVDFLLGCVYRLGIGKTTWHLENPLQPFFTDNGWAPWSHVGNHLDQQKRKGSWDRWGMRKTMAAWRTGTAWRALGHSSYLPLAIVSRKARCCSLNFYQRVSLPEILCSFWEQLISKDEQISECETSPLASIQGTRIHEFY